jgi:ribonuclease J
MTTGCAYMPKQSMTSDAPLRIIPLGGLGEIGMNCLVLESGGARIVIDCGITFDDRGLGVDTCHADLAWLTDEPERVSAVFLTHGHEDHIGAIPHLLERVAAPVYGPPYALALVRERLGDRAAHFERSLHTMRPRDRVQAGPFEVEPYRVTHSMPDCTGLIIRTPHGVVVHSGDFKIDRAPIDGDTFDFDRLARLRDEEGVRLLLSDSTNALVPGESGSEQVVASKLDDLVRDATGRVIVTLFASNVQRIRALAQTATRSGRKLCLLGRSLETHARIAEAAGLLPELAAVRVPRELARAVPRAELLVAATGSQGEAPAALARLASDTHYDLSLEPGDLVVHSARVIPGHDRTVYDLINAFERRGVEVAWAAVQQGVHVSGHAHRGEQRALIELLQPRSFLPIHGTYVHLSRHAALARECGVADVLFVENGREVTLSADGLRLAGTVASGRVYRERGRVVHPRVIRDRALLAELGVAVVTLMVDRRGKPVGQCDVLTRGVLVEEENERILDEACDVVVDALERAQWVVDRPSDLELEVEAKRALKRFFAQRVGKKPLCYAVVLRPPTDRV